MEKGLNKVVSFCVIERTKKGNETDVSNEISLKDIQEFSLKAYTAFPMNLSSTKIEKKPLNTISSKEYQIKMLEALHQIPRISFPVLYSTLTNCNYFHKLHFFHFISNTFSLFSPTTMYIRQSELIKANDEVSKVIGGILIK